MKIDTLIKRLENLKNKGYKNVCFAFLTKNVGFLYTDDFTFRNNGGNAQMTFQDNDIEVSIINGHKDGGF